MEEATRYLKGDPFDFGTIPRTAAIAMKDVDGTVHFWKSVQAMLDGEPEEEVDG